MFLPDRKAGAFSSMIGVALSLVAATDTAMPPDIIRSSSVVAILHGFAHLIGFTHGGLFAYFPRRVHALAVNNAALARTLKAFGKAPHTLQCAVHHPGAVFMQMITAASTDPKIKNIQNEITDVEQQMQKISSKEELSVNEKTDERKKLKKEISSLNEKLKQQQEELLRAQRRESMLAELRENKKPAKEEESEDKVQTKEISSDKSDEKNLPADQQQTSNQDAVITKNNDGTVVLKADMNQNDTRDVDTTKEQDDEVKEKSISEKEPKAADNDTTTDSGLSHKEVHAMLSADSSVQQANQQGSVIARTRDGIAILKGEMNQDEKRGVDTERKQNELEKMEKQEQRATSFQSYILGEANNTMKSAAEINVAGIKDSTQTNADGNAYINALNLSQGDDQAAQQRFYVSFS